MERVMVTGIRRVLAWSGLVLAIVVATAVLAPFASPARPISAATSTFSNSATITINDGTTASPYPSTIAVSGVVGAITRVTVKITGYSHAYPDDVAVLLVAPSGKKIKLMSDVGGD